jgi:hypothetical protein
MTFSIKSLSLLGLGTLAHYVGSTLFDEKQSKASPEKSPASSSPAIDAERLDTYILMLKVVKKVLKYTKKGLLQVKYFMSSGITSTNLSEWLHSPKAVESMVLLAGTAGMAYGNFKPFEDNSSLFSKVTAIGGSLLAESKTILSMHQLMTSLSDLARNRKPPLKALSIAGAMILANHLANWHSNP